MDFLGDVGGMY